MVHIGSVEHVRSLTSQLCTEAARQDEALAITEAPMPAYLATDSEESNEDEDYVPSFPIR